MQQFEEVSTLSFAYGQRHELAELSAARKIADRRGVKLTQANLKDVFPLGMPADTSGVDDVGVNRANIPGRNLAFLTIGAAHAAAKWPRAKSSLVIGCNGDDALSFPDCGQVFLDRAINAIATGIGQAAEVVLCSPWIQMRKWQVVQWCEPQREVMRDISDSVSCYEGTECDKCGACQLRKQAFQVSRFAQSKHRKAKR
jgi:queuosine biosynthesis protein QueC